MTNVPVYLGLGGFPGHRTSSANTGKILRRPAWWVTLGGCWAFGDRGKHRVEPVCGNPKCLPCTTSPAWSLLSSLQRRCVLLLWFLKPHWFFKVWLKCHFLCEILSIQFSGSNRLVLYHWDRPMVPSVLLKSKKLLCKLLGKWKALT